MKKALLVMAIAMAAIFARAQLLTPWKAPVECDIPTVTKLYGTQMSAKAVASTASQRSIKAITPTASQTWWGYFSESNASSLDFSGNLGYGSAVTLNAAIMVEGSNSFVKGSTIKAVRFWLADDLSAISSDLTLWISKSLPASASAADYTQTIPKANISSRLNEVELTTPYDATSMQSGDKLYIGFSFSISGRAYPIMAGGTDMSGGFYYNTGSSWIDFVGEGYNNGNLALQLLLDGGTYPTNCASIDNIGQEVVKSGSSVSIPCKITNKGIDDITSLEFTIKDANGSTQTVTRTLSNSLALNNSTSISLSFDAASTPQKSDISVTVTKVNGVDNTLSASDGLKVGTGTLITVSSAPTVVPVVEEFTGTWCGYCPYGTVAMQKAHQQYGDEIVQIAIHSGDPMAVSDYSPVISAYCDGYPNATIDRQSTFHAANIPYRLTSAFNRVSQGMIELTAEWSDAGKTAVKFNTKSTFGYSDNNGQYGIALVLTEDGMTGTSSNWSQNNYLSGGSGDSDMQFWYNSPSTVSGLEYDHVAVAVWNALNGADGSIPSSFTADTPIEYSFTGDISSNTLIQDKTKLKAIALLIDRVSGNIVNAAQCSLGGETTPVDDPDEPYAVLSDDNTVLTFYYDGNKASRNGMDVGGFGAASKRGWDSACKRIQSVVFDASFANCTSITRTTFWFDGCSALESITGIENLKTDNVTDMSWMFSGCSSLTSLDVSGFNTSNVIGMFSMFYGCSGLTSLDVSGFKTDKVTKMILMFYGCSGLTSLDVSGFKTASVTDMSSMFGGCSGLTSLNLSGFNTVNVTDMEGMFSGCSGLTNLGLNGLKTANVTNMTAMFQNCSGLTNLDLSGLNTDNVTDMGRMFDGCSGLTSLDLSGLKTANVTNMAAMFQNCSGLTNLDLSGLNTNNVTDMGGMFYGCNGLTNLDLSGLNTDNVMSMERMFRDCRGLTSLDLSGFKTDNVTSMKEMFRDCRSLTSLDVSGLNTANVTDMSWMFRDCNGLTSLDVSGFKTDNVKNMTEMFSGCSGLTSLDVSGFNTENVTSMGAMFRFCSSLTSLDVSGFKTDSVTYMGRIFINCSSLKSLDLSSFNTENATFMGQMFQGCSGLTSIYAGDGWNTDKVETSTYMFSGCSSLVGGAGTEYNSSYTDKTYARIDGGTAAPGYFTDKNGATPALGNITFADANVKALCVAKWDTNGDGELSKEEAAAVTDLGETFKGNEQVKSFDELQYFTGLTSIGDYAFDNCGLTSITIPNSVTTIGEWAFYNCYSLTSIVISNHVTSIGEYAFAFCKGLTSFTIPNSVTTIGEHAFGVCSGLTSITIPNSVTSIKNWTFHGCKGLTSIEIPNSVTSIGESAFSFCSSLTSVSIPNSVTSIGLAAFSDCTGLTSINIPSSVTKIGTYAFSSCSSLTSVTVDPGNPIYDSRNGCNAIIRTADNTLVVGCPTTTIPSSVTTIGEQAFSFCSGLTSITIPNSVTSIESLAFYRCTGLTSIEIPNSVTSIGDSAFDGCTGLTSIEIPNSVTSIGNSAFDSCTGLTSIEIPNSVTSIGEMAFFDCSGLTEFHSLIETPFAINENTFWSNNEAEFSYDETKLYETIKLYVPAGTAEAYKATDGWKNFKSIIEVVDERAITITAENKTMVYGEALPEFTFKSEGGNLTGKPVISCEATATSPAGTYPIIVAKGTLANPNVTYVAGTLTITKAPLTIRAGSYTKKQGEKNPEFALSYEGFKNGETESVLSKQPVVTCEATATSEPGEYAIAVSGAEANNYEISYVAGKLTVTEADQIILTANSYTRKYGEENPQFGYVVDGTELSGTPAVTCEATAASPAGTYPITINKGTVTNPNVTYVAGTLTITKAPLTISVGDYNKVEGEDNPEFALSYDGFKNNDTEAVLKKQPVITTEATKDSKAGEYAITVSGAEAENYDITYVAGKLTIEAKPEPEPVVVVEPVEELKTVTSEDLRGQDLSDNVVDNIYYNVGEDGYDPSDWSVVINEPTNMAQIENKEPGSADVKENFNGIIMKVGKGFGLITVSAKTSGNAQLVVQVGESGMPMIASRTEKGDVVASYDVSEDTYVYIYAIKGSSAAKLVNGDVKDNDSDIVRIYGITVSPGATGVRSVNGNGDVNNDAYYTLDGKKLDTAPKKGGIYVKQGRKVVK